MKRGSTLYCVDIAEKMLDVFDLRFKTNDFSRNPDNYHKRIETSSLRTKENIESIEEAANVGPTGRRVFSLVSDIEQLPFPDQTFDAYTANLVLQFTPNYINMLVEAYRTLKSNAKAAFSVWGREENCTFITFVPEILERHGIRVDQEVYDNFDSVDVDQIIEDAKEIGFRSVKTFNLPSHYSIINGNEMWELLNNTSTKKYFESLTEETVAKVRKDIIKEFDERYGSDNEEMICFEVTVILCVK